MPPASWTTAELNTRRTKSLANTYTELLEEFSAKDLRTVGNYTVGRLIGKGSFGKVYLASHKLTNGSKVVLKSAKRDDANLAREIHHHRQFLHPHIARLYEVIVTENLVWLVLEYCPGDELYNHLLQHGRMPEAKVQKIFTQLVGAVSYVHSKSCVHRDLKLENILLDKHGDVKLLDFGFAREYQGTSSYLQTWCGTVCYSAPEMLKGDKYAGEKVDVWSLGIILFALLCGELPFDDDDESATKARILKEDAMYPDYVPEGARDLLMNLLSRRPLLRPSLADILKHPWLAEHAPQQQEILKVQQPSPFSTELEKSTLQRMRSAGVNIDMVIEHVLSQRCDSLAGWWALLMEKEERKERRRQRKRKESLAETRSIRRLSASSSKLLNTPILREINEEGHSSTLAAPSHSRGRKVSRSSVQPPDLPSVNESRTPEKDETTRPPPPPQRDSIRSTSSSRPRPAYASKEYSRRPRAHSRHSSQVLQTARTESDLLAPPPFNRRRKKAFREQLASIKSWFKDPTKRTKSPELSATGSSVSPFSKQHDGVNGSELRHASTTQLLDIRKASQQHRPELQPRATLPARPRVSTASSYGSSGSHSHNKRPSVSPAPPLTPRSSVYRRSSGLRGRKSTSSSVSSVRSIHGHRHSHSKASSTSSTSIASPSNLSSTSRAPPRSPSASVRILPPAAAVPTDSTLPSGIRVSRRPPPGMLGTLPTFEQQRNASGPFGGFGPPSPGMHPVFAKQKRRVFKGPNLTPASGIRARSTGSGDGGSRGSMQGRRSGELVITEEDEEEDEEGGGRMFLGEEDGMEVEEVEAFSPIEEGTAVFVVMDGKEEALPVDEMVEGEKEDSAHGADGLGIVDGMGHMHVQERFLQP